MTFIKKINSWTIVTPVNISIVVTPEEEGLWNAAGTVPSDFSFLS